MKKTLVLSILFLILFSMIQAENPEDLNITSDMSLMETAQKTGIPYKKLISYMNVSDSVNISTKLSALNLGKADVDKAIVEFNKIEKSMYGTITLIGMLVVFSSLLIIGIIIAQLEHLANYEKWKEKKKEAKAKKTAAVSVKTDIGTISTDMPQTSMNAIAAVIATLHMHVSDAERQQKMLLTWKRIPSSLWKAYNITDMPNRAFNKRR